jgi:hypothetical protein
MFSDLGQIKFCNKDERLGTIMFKVTKKGVNRLDLELSGKLDTEERRTGSGLEY